MRAFVLLDHQADRQRDSHLQTHLFLDGTGDLWPRCAQRTNERPIGVHVPDQSPNAKTCGTSVDGAYDTSGDSSRSSGSWGDPVSEEERGRADGIQRGRRRSPGEAAVDQLVPALLGASPCQAFQAATEVYGHPAGVFGVPQEDDVAKGVAQMAEAQCDALDLTPAPRGQVAIDAQVPRVEAELG